MRLIILLGLLALLLVRNAAGILLTNLAALSLVHSRFAVAAHYARLAVRLDGEQQQAMRILGIVHLLHQEPSAAVSALASAVEIDTTGKVLLYDYGLALHAAGRKNQAVRYWKKAGAEESFHSLPPSLITGQLRKQISEKFDLWNGTYSDDMNEDGVPDGWRPREGSAFTYHRRLGALGSWILVEQNLGTKTGQDMGYVAQNVVAQPASAYVLTTKVKTSSDCEAAVIVWALNRSNQLVGEYGQGWVRAASPEGTDGRCSFVAPTEARKLRIVLACRGRGECSFGSVSLSVER